MPTSGSPLPREPERPPDPIQFREEDHHLRFSHWTQPKGAKHHTPWYECVDCGATFSEAYPTVMPPATDCPARKDEEKR